MREVFYKRFLSGSFYVKREGDNYWLGHYSEDRSSAELMRITKETYVRLLAERALRRAK